MYIDKIINKLSPSLILCLAGWSTSPELFRHLEVPEQTDLWIAYDYRTLAFEETFAPYKEVHLVAWSLGVWVATRLWAGHRSFTTATALNGTPFPMHDTLGIPTAIFEGTLHHISEEGMRRFNRRMCGDKETFNRYSELSPRPLEEIKEELESLYNQILPEKLESADPRISTFWDQAILSTEDKIPGNQPPELLARPLPHPRDQGASSSFLPLSIMERIMEVIEQERIRRRFSQAVNTYDDHADAQKRICAHLVQLLTAYTSSHFRRVLEIGCGSGGFTRLLKQECQIEEWVLNDLCETWQSAIEELFPSATPLFLAGDAERLAFPGTFDLIASASALQWMKDLPRFLHKLSSTLSPGGMLAFNTFTPDNLHEIKELTGEGLTYPTAGQLREWLSTYFRIVHEEEGNIALTFRHPLEVLRHLKYTGVTANASCVWTRGKQERFCRDYQERFPSADGGVTLTYRPLYILVVKR